MWADRILGPRTLFFFNFLKFLVELQFYVITPTATATAVINFSTTALEPQPRFLKIPQPKEEPQLRFSENSQPIHHYTELLVIIALSDSSSHYAKTVVTLELYIMLQCNAGTVYDVYSFVQKVTKRCCDEYTNDFCFFAYSFCHRFFYCD